MKKKMFAFLLAFTATLSSLKAQNLEYLKGDEASACEVLLCLSSPTQPAECAKSLARYFAISFSKPWKTIQARKNFLNLCPQTDIKTDPELDRYVNEILPNIDSDCSVHTLNNREEKVVLRVERICNDMGGSRECKDVNIYGFRTNPKLTQSCTLLSSSKYTDYRLKYTCNSTFYEQKDWNNGYTKQEISKTEYDKLQDSEKLAENIRLSFNKTQTIYYKKIPIKKDCWINEAK